jgi:hypothetical protein
MWLICLKCGGMKIKKKRTSEHGLRYFSTNYTAAPARVFVACRARSNLRHCLARLPQISRTCMVSAPLPDIFISPFCHSCLFFLPEPSGHNNWISTHTTTPWLSNASDQRAPSAPQPPWTPPARCHSSTPNPNQHHRKRSTKNRPGPSQHTRPRPHRPTPAITAAPRT